MLQKEAVAAKEELTGKEAQTEKIELEKNVVATTTSTTGLVVAGISTEESKRLEKRLKEVEAELDEKDKTINKFEKENIELNETIKKLRSQSGNNDIVSNILDSL